MGDYVTMRSAIRAAIRLLLFSIPVALLLGIGIGWMIWG